MYARGFLILIMMGIPNNSLKPNPPRVSARLRSSADARLLSALGLKPEKPMLSSDGISTAEAQTVGLDSIVGGLSRKDLRVITRNYKKHVATRGFFSDRRARTLRGRPTGD